MIDNRVIFLGAHLRRWEDDRMEGHVVFADKVVQFNLPIHMNAQKNMHAHEPDSD
jgi:hypothetical protein